MKKCFYFLVLISITLTYFFTVSCNDQPTYEELKAAEMKVIKRMLTDQNIEVLDKYPENGVFGENQFFQLSSGIYLNIVDSGNGNRAVYNETIVLIRTKGFYYDFAKDTVYTFNTFINRDPPFEFKFGSAYGVVYDHSYNYYSPYYAFFSMGLESILSYVGDSSIVKLIVPGYAEINSTPASSTFQTSSNNAFIPIFYDRVRYTFY